MNLHTKRARLAACTVGALSATILAVSASPASASGTYSGLAYVYGADFFQDDWNNEGVTDANTNAYSNATCLWQMTLWANGFLSSKTYVDGIFGSQTKTATANYQSGANKWGANLKVDGSAGKATWGDAADNIGYVSGSTASGGSLTLTYYGWNPTTGVTGRNFSMKRGTDGNYQFVDGDGAWRNAGYNYRTCS
ncbi:peptidoglycan-binding domain-containing protein [Streptomyces sp. NPDC004721]